MIRETQQCPDGGIKVTQAGQTFDSTEYVGVQTGDQGRGLVLLNAGETTVFGCNFNPGSDDALGLVGDCKGTLVTGCTFPLRYFGANNPSKALVAYTGLQSNVEGPLYGAEHGYAGTFVRNRFDGSAIRIRDGVWRFEGCDIAIGQLYGIDMIDPCKANIVGCNFRTIAKPADATYWGGAPAVRVLRHVKNSDGTTKYLTTSLKSRLYIANCTIDGVPATPQQICPGVPSYVFRTTPN